MGEVRAARPGDAAYLGEIQVAAWQVGYVGVVPDSYLRKLNPAMKAAGFAGRIADPKPGRRLLVHVGAGGHVDGFAAYGRSAGTGEVFALYVHPARQRQGIGSTLLIGVEEQLGLLGHERAQAWTFAEHTAGLAFWAARGWTPDSATGSWLLGDRACPEVRLGRTLSRPAERTSDLMAGQT